MLDRTARTVLNSARGTSVLRKYPRVGIELEYENAARLDPGNSSYWSLQGDGSLRNAGAELVSVPLSSKDTPLALNAAEKFVQKAKVEATYRCGLHVHLNMLPYNVGNLWSFLALYALVEPSIFETYAKGRDDSIFAVPMWENSQQMHGLFRDVTYLRSRKSSDSQYYMSSLTQVGKYCAMNTSSWGTFGTFEMRQPYCTTDFKAIHSWLAFCWRLYQRGVAYDDPLDVLNEYEGSGLEALQEQLFGVSIEVPEDLQDSAEDAANFVAGYMEPPWEDLDWNINVTETR